MNATLNPSAAPVQAPHIVLEPRLRTSNQQLSALLTRLVRSATWHLCHAAKEARLWRESTGKTWASAEYAVWSRIFSSRTEACICFRHLRETLHPADYRAALQCAREIRAQIRQRQEIAATF